MIGNVAADIVQLQSYISSDLAEAGAAQRTIFTGSLPQYQLKHEVQKDRVNQAQKIGQGEGRNEQSSENSPPCEGVKTRESIRIYHSIIIVSIR